MHLVKRLTLLSLAFVLLAGHASAQPIQDPAGDLLPIYVGPQQGNLDVVYSGVLFTGTGFLFFATMVDEIGDYPETLGRYVWGVDRGLGAQTASFARLGLPDIKFDAVVAARYGGVSVVNDLVTEIATPLPPENVIAIGKTILVWVPLSMLPSYVELPPQEYMWNLWPRWDGIPMSDEQISDFAPDDRNARVSVVR